MKYSKKLLYIDIALIVSFLPLFFILPIFMKLYFFIGIIFIFLKKPYIKTAALIGFALFFMSFYQSFNFYGISTFETFIIMLISLLEIGVILQRLKGINFYLLISPLLFLMLSMFLFTNVFMLFYSIFEIFLAMFLILLYKIDDIKEAIKLDFVIFLVSLPFVIVLFLFSPRKSYFSSSFGFHQGFVTSGFSNRMYVSNKAVISSNQIVMEVSFSQMPDEFYFRGNVLYKNYGAFWDKTLAVPRDILQNPKNLIVYREKMYPTNDTYFFALDLPTEAFKGAYLTKFFTIKLEKPLKDTLNIKLNSFTHYTLKLPFIPLVALEVNRHFNKKTQKAIKDIVKIKDKNKRLQALIKFFASKKVVYTLKPPKMDPLNIVDELLFNKKRGYCVHFASAFAILARLAHLPSRVVTGFLGHEFYKNYMVIRAKDAHAWVEVYTDRWVRVDPVEFAYNIKKTKKSIKNLNTKKKIKEDKNLFLMYLRFKIEEWILYYDVFTQNKLIKYIKSHKIKIFLIISLILLFLILIVYVLLKCKTYECYMQKLLKKLEKTKKRNLTIYQYLKSFNNKELDKINILYHKVKFFHSTKEEKKELIKKIKNFKGFKK